jgi:hypothetical protein
MKNRLFARRGQVEFLTKLLKISEFGKNPEKEKYASLGNGH